MRTMKILKKQIKDQGIEKKKIDCQGLNGGNDPKQS